MKKRFLSILTTLCLCLTLLPATAMAESGSIDQAKFVVTNWGALQTNLENSTKEVIDATLEKDITWGGSSLTVPEGKNVTINLNAHSIDAQNQGTVVPAVRQEPPQGSSYLKVSSDLGQKTDMFRHSLALENTRPWCLVGQTFPRSNIQGRFPVSTSLPAYGQRQRTHDE